MNRHLRNIVYCACLIAISLSARAQDPNILLIIADDLGVDVFNGYHATSVMPTTPTLDSIRDAGILFENAWSTPVCTSTRATIMSGKYGVKTGVLTAPGHLSLSDSSLFTHLNTGLPNKYEGAVVGKWHISHPADENHPYDHGLNYYSGVLAAAVDDYFDWSLTSYGVTNKSTAYATKVFTDTASTWINNQSKPWIMWLAHVAPHSPLHLPPDSMFTLKNYASNYRKYLTMIESLDFTINRLLKSMPQNVKDNTIIFFIGDNGTPNNYLQNYPANHGKGTIYEGGIRIPMLVSGKGVTRIGVREPALVHVNDIHSTILELAGIDLPGGKHNSLSFAHLLDGSAGPTKDYNYSEITSIDVDGWTIRNKQYKLIHFQNGSEEFYDLLTDSLETDNLIAKLSTDQTSVKTDLENEAAQIRTSWSCRDHIQNGDEEQIDCGGSVCNPCLTNVSENKKRASIYVHPNPVANLLHVKGLSNFNMLIFNASGQMVIESAVSPINVSELPSGNYHYQITSQTAIKNGSFQVNGR